MKLLEPPKSHLLWIRVNHADNRDVLCWRESPIQADSTPSSWKMGCGCWTRRHCIQPILKPVTCCCFRGSSKCNSLVELSGSGQMKVVIVSAEASKVTMVELFLWQRAMKWECDTISSYWETGYDSTEIFLTSYLRLRVSRLGNH